MLKSASSITNAIGELNYIGTWDASTNTPALASGSGTKGDYYIVSVSGSTALDGISSWGVGDWAIFSGTVWQRVERSTDLNGANLLVSGNSDLGNVRVAGNTISSTDANGNINIDPNGTGTVNVPANMELTQGSVGRIQISGSAYSIQGGSTFGDIRSYSNRWRWYAANGTTLVGNLQSTSFFPGVDNTASCGGASFRWTVVYATTGTINTSDERTKQQIQPIDDAVLRAWGKVNFCQYKFNDAVEKKGDGARWHFGLLAQHVKEAFEGEGLDPFAYGILCHDSWDEQPAVYADALDKDGNPTGEKILVESYRAAGDRYGVRYEEALALECAYLRSLHK